MKHIFSLVLGCICAISGAFAAIPTGYYSGANGKTSDAALTALNEIIDDHTVISYKNLEDYYKDIDFDSAGYLMDMYSTCKLTMADANKSQSKVCDAWNKEHSIPQSWFGEKSPMKSDLFHVIPTDARVNNFRSNYAYGETSSTAYIDDNPKARGHLGSSNFEGYSGKVYEPDDQFKGDFARIYFYMVARYRNEALNSSVGSDVFTSKPTNLTTYATKLFLKWHRQDPVSTKEIKRNEAVYKVQKNRNPFVDYPYLVEYIWGTQKGQKVDFTKMISSQDPRFIPGVSDGQLTTTDPTIYPSVSALTFTGAVAEQTLTQTLQVSGINLTSAITLTITGENATCFSVAPTSIAQASATTPQTVTVSYTPLQTGTHHATLALSATGATTQYVTLQGACQATCSVTWLVDGDRYMAGSPTSLVAFGQKISALPTAPASCSTQSEQFVGWTSDIISAPQSQAPADLFSDTAHAQPITQDITYRAVFAHVEQQAGDPQTISMNMTQSSGWTLTKTTKKSSYYLLKDNSSVTSPEVDLSRITSIQINARTYGGSTFNTIQFAANETTLGSIVATSNSLKDYTWSPAAGTALKGTSAIIFSSPTTSTDNGPAFSSIAIMCSGTKYVYSAYLTECTSTPTEELPVTEHNPSHGHTIIRNGQLFILHNGVLYSILGEPIINLQ